MSTRASYMSLLATRINSSGNLQTISGGTISHLQATLTESARTTITTNNSGYAQLQKRTSNDDTWYTFNSNGITIQKAGLVYLTYDQDIITAGTTGYVTTRVVVNGGIAVYQLITNTGSQWDCIHSSWSGYCGVGTTIAIEYAAADITSIDPGTWSNYNFLWISQ